jgi:DNA modification methylase
VKIEEVRIDEISNHERNPKQHPDKQIRLLEESIKRFGWTNPVILSADNTILAGHARVKAAIAAGNDTVPCIRTKLTGAEADAYLLADNRLSDIAPYDRDILAELLSDLPKDLVDITGFDSVQVDALLSGEDIPDIEKFISDSQPEEEREEVDAEPQIDRAAELNEKWQVKTGDLWQCGEHRLICGDCTDPAVVERVMGGEKADLCFTSPPYNAGEINQDTNKNTKPKYRGANDALTEDQYNTFVSAFVDISLKHADEVFVNIGLVQGNKKSIVGLLWKYKEQFKDLIYWKKSNAAPHIQPGIINNLVEFIICFGDGKRKFKNAQFSQGTYYNVIEGHGAGNNSNETKNQYHDIHKATFPLYLPSHVIDNFSNPAALILDPFLGSGTTMIACENTGRKCRGIEISPDYVAVCLQRYQDATGKEPVRING